MGSLSNVANGLYKHIYREAIANDGHLPVDSPEYLKSEPSQRQAAFQLSAEQVLNDG